MKHLKQESVLIADLKIFFLLIERNWELFMKFLIHLLTDIALSYKDPYISSL